MTLERADIADRLRPLLSAEPQTAGELMTRAGLSINRRLAGVTSAALRQLREEGVAKAQGSIPHVKWTRVDATTPQGVETVALRGLDATVTLTTTVRVTPGGTRRTELAAVVELGPSWPEGTRPPPRWSTAFSDAQLATGALHGARSNAIARAEAQLRALRKDKTLPLLPTEERMTRPNPLLLPSKNRDDFFAYLASIDRGARQDSACAWLAKRAIAQTTDEALAWLDDLVVRRLLDERVGVAPDGSRVVRYSPAIPTTPAPLPKSSAPAEELPAGKSLPAPKVTPKKAPAPPPAAPVDDQDTGDPEDDEGALDDPAEHDSDDPPQVEESGDVARLTRERDEMERKWKDVLRLLDSGLGSGDDMRLRFCSALSLSAQVEWPAILGRVRDVRDEHARLADRLATLTTERDDLALRRERTESHRYHLAAMAGVDGGAPWEDVLVGVARALQRREAKHPQHYQGDPAEQFATSIAGWLVSLSEETWLEVTRARHQLAESRRLREQSHSLELHALDALDRAVGARPAAPPAPVAAPAPAPELVPDPIELGPALPATPEPPASGEQANDQAEGGTMLERVRRFFEQNPTETVNAPQLGPRLGCLAKHVSPSLSILFREGFLEKPRLGFYRLARKGRRAA